MKGRDKIKILLIGPLPVSGGGASISFLQIVKDLRKKHNVLVTVLDTGRKKGGNFVQNFTLSAVTISKLIHELFYCDIVSFHASPRGIVYFGPIIYYITRIFRKPLIIRVFGGVLDRKYESMSNISRKCIETIFKSDIVLLQTKRLINYFRRKYPQSNILWYPTSRPSLNGQNVTKKNLSSKLKFVFLGHVKPTKGILEIIQASKLIDKYNFSVDIYGPLRDGITKRTFTDNKKINYCGKLDSQNIMATLSNYDVLLLPTYHSGEGYPGAIIEAYMTGLPVITTNWISIPEIVEDGVSGILIPPKNPKALAFAMESLLVDLDKVHALKIGTSKYRELFSSEKWTNVFLDIVYDALYMRI